MIRIFVGCAAGDDAESQAVLEYTLRKQASQQVEIHWMQYSDDPASPWRGWNTERWSTPFSGFRWAVPQLCGFSGRAIYMDSDCIVLADIAELWQQDFKPGKSVIAKGGRDGWRFCVTMFDCAAVRPHMMPIQEMRKRPDAHQMMIGRFRDATFVQPFAGNWNCIDGEDYADLADPDIKLIHYSAEHTQPHLRYAVPRLVSQGRRHWFDGKIKAHWRPDLMTMFDRLLGEAAQAGFLPENYLPPAPLAPYRIASHKNYQPHRWAR